MSMYSLFLDRRGISCSPEEVFSFAAVGLNRVRQNAGRDYDALPQTTKPVLRCWSLEPTARSS